MRRLKNFLAALCILQLMATGLIANAANTTSSNIRKNVTGTVKDALGRPMEGVALILQTQDGRIVSPANTDKAGRFEFKNVAPGMYAVVANKIDFKTAALIVTVTSAGAKPLDLANRIDGIELPEGIAAGFSQTFSPRFAQSISLLEGALPAQYGYHTAGVVEIQTKSGDSLNGGDIDMYGGQRDTLQPSFELGGSKGNLSYYTTGYYLQDARGLEPPTPGPQAHHDFATIGNGFGYLSYFLNTTTRLSAIGGFNLSNFQIPSNPGQTPAFTLAGVNSFPSVDIRETQFEQNYFGVLALQGIVGEYIDYQIAGFTRYSTLSFHPDQEGDLIYNGVASRDFRGDWANGLQGDFAYRALASHTFRAGFYFTGERAEIDNHALVFPGSAAGQCTGPHVPPCDEPEAIVDDHAYTQWLYSVYLQDEWRPLRKLTLNYGVRFDLYDGLTRSDQFSPRVGAVYQLFEGTALHAAYARYFTPPPLEAVSGADISKFIDTTKNPRC